MAMILTSFSTGILIQAAAPDRKQLRERLSDAPELMVSHKNSSQMHWSLTLKAS